MQNLPQLEGELQQPKESWSKPELKLIDVKAETLGTPSGTGTDAGIYS